MNARGAVKMWAKWWLIGTALTFFVAWMLWRRHHEAMAAAVIMISPFPWPGPEA